MRPGWRHGEPGRSWPGARGEREREELLGTRLVESLTKSREPPDHPQYLQETLCLDDVGDVVVA